jgi:hypothetical protein
MEKCTFFTLPGLEVRLLDRPARSKLLPRPLKFSMEHSTEALGLYTSRAVSSAIRAWLWEQPRLPEKLGN